MPKVPPPSASNYSSARNSELKLLASVDDKFGDAKVRAAIIKREWKAMGDEDKSTWKITDVSLWPEEVEKLKEKERQKILKQQKKAAKKSAELEVDYVDGVKRFKCCVNEATQVALGSYDPTSYFNTADTPKLGKAELSFPILYGLGGDRAVYLFESEDSRRVFSANPSQVRSERAERASCSNTRRGNHTE